MARACIAGMTKEENAPRFGGWNRLNSRRSGAVAACMRTDGAPGTGRRWSGSNPAEENTAALPCRRKGRMRSAAAVAFCSRKGMRGACRLCRGKAYTALPVMR